MSFYFVEEVRGGFEAVLERVRLALSAKGFGIVTEIDLEATFQAKLGRAFRPYRVLGACAPDLAWRALEIDDKVGLILPCNVIVQEISVWLVSVAAVNPLDAMLALDDGRLHDVAATAAQRLREAVHSLRQPTT